ncbi:fimbrial protein [Pandoraea commovens]|uniref:Fimbrial protein n=1 Tax=Pandoraea commovens TaxID=2508289 RepID=A0ABY5QD28_9BURK|nr:fimbrial protein [Pandoraea commovens]UVA78559.1 fimbrial protein [Pandoraea commovens]
MTLYDAIRHATDFVTRVLLTRTQRTGQAIRTGRGARTMVGAALVSALTMTQTTAMANVTVSPIASVISSGQQQVSIIRITSQSTQAQYVDVSVRRIVAPATPDEHEVAVNIEQGDGLVASPAKFVLAAGATRLVRVVALGRPQVEAAYRVYFRPATAPDDTPARPTQGAFENDVNVSFVWGALVRVEPAKRAPGLASTEDNTALRNIGNVRAHVLAMGRCTGDAEHTCQWHDIGRSIYPGMTQPIPDALRDAQVRIRYRVDGVTNEQVMDLPRAP